MGWPGLIQHSLCKSLANRVVGELVGMLLDPLEGQGLDILQIVVGIMLTAVALDLAHLLALACTE